MNGKLVIVTILLVALGICRSSLAGEMASRIQLVTYAWPIQAIFSDKYQVFVRCGEEAEREVTVLMSRALYKGDYRAQELEGRTFSFVPLSFNPAGGHLTVRVVKLFGDPAESATIHPRSYGIKSNLASAGKEITFQIDAASRYMSVHFSGKDNETANQHWIKHMLCIFVDPVETDVPDRKAPGVVTYSPNLAPEILTSAKTIFFPAGYHNLRDYHLGGIIDNDGQLLLQNGQSLYLEGGAFVEGIIGKANNLGRNQSVYGRGILSGRQYLWSKNPDFCGTEYRQILTLGDKGRVEGITVMESPMHGITSWGSTRITNVKFLGWHCNNDGIRVGEGSEISNCFIRAVDDHFYNFKIHVHNVVLWAGHNGSVLTYGWAGSPDYGQPGRKESKQTRSYRSGASLFEDIDIIHPEWTGLGNNNGLIMSQVRPDFKPYGYGGETTTIMRNIRIEGSIPGLVNLKPHSTGGGGDVLIEPVAPDNVGYLGDLVLENISVDAQFGKSRIKGALNVSKDGGKIFYIQNLRFNDIRIGGKMITESNWRDYFDIDDATTRDIRFTADSRKNDTLKNNDTKQEMTEPK